EPACLDADAGTGGRADRERRPAARRGADPAVLVPGGWEPGLRAAAVPEHGDPPATGTRLARGAVRARRRTRTRPDVDFLITQADGVARRVRYDEAHVSSG